MVCVRLEQAWGLGKFKRGVSLGSCEGVNVNLTWN